MQSFIILNAGQIIIYAETNRNVCMIMQCSGSVSRVTIEIEFCNFKLVAKTFIAKMWGA